MVVSGMNVSELKYNGVGIFSMSCMLQLGSSCDKVIIYS